VTTWAGLTVLVTKVPFLSIIPPKLYYIYTNIIKKNRDRGRYIKIKLLLPVQKNFEEKKLLTIAHSYNNF
jgi:hypothetical protein